MNQKKAALVVLDAGAFEVDRIGGGQLACIDLLTEFKKRPDAERWDVYLVTTPNNDTLVHKYSPLVKKVFIVPYIDHSKRLKRIDFKLWHLPKVSKNLLTGLATLRRGLAPIVKEHGKRNVVLLANENISRTLVALLNILGSRKKAVCLLDNEYNQGKSDQILLKLWSRGFTSFFAVCQTILKNAPARLVRRSHFGYIGVDLPAIEKTCSHIQKSTGSGNPWRIAWIGSMGFPKRPDWAVEILSRLRQEKKLGRIELHMIGDGPSRKEVEALCQKLGLNDSVFFHGKLPPEETWKQLAQMDVLLHTSSTEAMPRVLFEAYTLGIPVVASAVGGIGEVVIHRVNGYLADPQNLDSYVEGLSDTLGNAAHFKTMREQAASMSTRFDRSKIAATFAQVISSQLA